MKNVSFLQEYISIPRRVNKLSVPFAEVLQGSYNLESSSLPERIAASRSDHDGNQFAMVSEWMASGNIDKFVAENQDMNRFDLVGFLVGLLKSPVGVDRRHSGSWQMWHEVWSICSHGMIHGDLKGVRLRGLKLRNF